MSSTTLSRLFSWRGAIVDSDLPAPAKQVALTLSLHMSERGDSCFPSQATLVSETSLSKSTVCTHLKTLEERGFLHREPGAKGRSTRYTAVVPDSAGAAPWGSAGAGLPSATDGHEVVKEVVKETPLPTVPSEGWSKAERNLVWDALVAVCGAPVTASEKTDFGKTSSELRAVIPRDATLADATLAMRGRAVRWAQRYPGAEFTHRVLRTHWSDLGGSRGDEIRGAIVPDTELEDDGTGQATF